MYLRQGGQLFFFQHLRRGSFCRAMNSFILLLPPERDLLVEFGDILAGSNSEIILEVPYDAFHATLFIRPSYGAGVYPEAVMTAEVHELGIQFQFRRSCGYNTAQVVVPALSGNSAYLPEGFDVAGQKELHSAAGIKVNIDITGPGQEENKTVHNPGRYPPQCPIHLGLFPRQERELMKHWPFAFSPVFAGMNREHGVTAGISIRL